MSQLLLTTDERIRLRRPCLDDLAAVFRIHGDPRTNTFNPAGPDPNLQASEDRLVSWLASWAEDGIGYHAVVDRESDQVVGFTGVRHVNAQDWAEPAEPLLNLYYRYAPEAWGKGYATVAARRVLEWARTHRSQRPVVVITRPVNKPSLAVARALGFVHHRDITYGGAPSVEHRRPV
jgi:RimJ/RimL family protein N-acetyltransferase